MAPNRCAFATTVVGIGVLPLPLRGNTSLVNVDVRADEDVVLDAHPVPELHAAFHGDPIADDDVVLDEDVIADVAVGADARAGQHVRERPDPRSGPIFSLSTSAVSWRKRRLRSFVRRALLVLLDRSRATAE